MQIRGLMGRFMPLLTIFFLTSCGDSESSKDQASGRGSKIPEDATSRIEDWRTQGRPKPYRRAKQITAAVDARLERKGKKDDIVWRLDFRNSQVSESELGGLKRFSKLGTLSLRASSATDSHLEQLKEFPNLRNLELSSTEISDDGLKHLEGMLKIRTLLLKDTKISDIGLKHLKGLHNLQYIDVTSSKISPKGVKELRDALPFCVVYPNLENSKPSIVADVEALGGIIWRNNNQTTLNLSKSEVDDAALGKILAQNKMVADKLTYLDLSDTKVTDAALSYVKGLSELLEIDLRNTQVKGAGLVHLRGLEELYKIDLGGTEIGDEAILQLDSLIKLEKLHLEGSKVTEEGMNKLYAILTNCEMFL